MIIRLEILLRLYMSFPGAKTFWGLRETGPGNALMIPKLDPKWYWNGNDPHIAPQMTDPDQKLTKIPRTWKNKFPNTMNHQRVIGGRCRTCISPFANPQRWELFIPCDEWPAYSPRKSIAQCHKTALWRGKLWTNPAKLDGTNFSA